MRLTSLDWDTGLVEEDKQEPVVQRKEGFRIEIKGVQGKNDVLYPEFSEGKKLWMYLTGYPKWSLIKRCRMVDISHPERGSLRTTYIPQKDSVIVVAPAGRGISDTYQRTVHDGQRIAHRMESGEQKLHRR